MHYCYPDTKKKCWDWKLEKPYLKYSPYLRKGLYVLKFYVLHKLIACAKPGTDQEREIKHRLHSNAWREILTLDTCYMYGVCAQLPGKGLQCLVYVHVHVVSDSLIMTLLTIYKLHVCIHTPYLLVSKLGSSLYKFEIFRAICNHFRLWPGGAMSSLYTCTWSVISIHSQ